MTGPLRNSRQHSLVWLRTSPGGLLESWARRPRTHRSVKEYSRERSRQSRRLPPKACADVCCLCFSIISFCLASLSGTRPWWPCVACFPLRSYTRGKSARLDLLHQNVVHDAGMRLIPFFDFSSFSFVPSRLRTPSTPGISLIFQPSPRFIRF